MKRKYKSNWDWEKLLHFANAAANGIERVDENSAASRNDSYVILHPHSAKIIFQLIRPVSLSRGL